MKKIQLFFKGELMGEFENVEEFMREREVLRVVTNCKLEDLETRFI